MRSRRSPQPRSWLSVVESASAGFIGTARLASDRPVPATETSFRGPGYALVAEVEVDRTLFGTAPDDTLVLHGQTSRPPEHRVGPHEDRFPPDRLRSVSYWDQAPQNDPTLVLCLLSDPAVVRALLGPDDDLPRAVRIIRDWTESGAGEAVVEQQLSGPDSQPAVCYVAGFELLARTTSDLPELVERFLRLPGRPDAAARGIMQLVQPLSDQLPDSKLVELARRLLHVMADERGPEGLVSYLTWFDAHRDRLARAESELAGEIRAQAELVGRRDFAGPDAEAWRQEVRRHARTLAEGEGG